VAQMEGSGEGLAPSPPKKYNFNYNNILFLSHPQTPIGLFIGLFIVLAMVMPTPSPLALR